MLLKAFGMFLLLLPLVAEAAKPPSFYVREQQYRFAQSDPRCSMEKQCSSEPFHSGTSNDYSLNFVEFKDSGELFDASQLTAAADQLRNARKNSGRTIVFIYIHGWHNNAEERAQSKSANCEDNSYTGDVAKFRNCGLEVLANTSGPASAGAPPRIVGIYLAWHGTDFGWPPFSYVPSYPFRRYAARSVGLTGMASALQSIFDVVREERGSYFVVAMGHSFGARVLEAADEIQNLNKYPNAGIISKIRQKKPVNAALPPELPVDMILYVNAATSHYISRQTIAEWKDTCSSADAPAACQQHPLYLAVSSRADILTALVMPIANVVFFAPLTDRYHIISAANTPWMQTHTIPRRLKSVPDSLPLNAFCFAVPTSQTQQIYYEVDPKAGKTPSNFWDMNTDHWIASVEGILHSIPGVRQLIVPHWVISSHGDVWNTGVFNMVRAVVEREQARSEGKENVCHQYVGPQASKMRP